MIGWRDAEGVLHQGSLFATFAALARGEAWSFPALRPHQREPWHAFTVQVAALALIRAGSDEPPADEAAWRDLLLALTPGQPEAWELVVEDWSKPALLQPPVVSAGNKSDYKTKKDELLYTPDALDMLVTAKNHDLKQERIEKANDQDWLFALVALQTTEGIMGAGKYGISRMFGGYGNRMSLGVRSLHGGQAAAFKRDVGRLVADAPLRSDRRNGTPLTWVLAWDGTQSLDITKLDELYVEVCRRVRLRRGPNGIEGLQAGSKCARIAAEHLGGNTKDPWMPLIIDTKKGRATEGKLVGFTPAGSGFNYRQMSRLLDRDKVTAPLLAELHSTDELEGLSIVAAALVRGQGKTEGLHRRTIRTSRMEEIEEYAPARAFDRVGEIAARRSLDAGEATNRLRNALILMVQGGPAKGRFDDDAAKKKVEPWLERFDGLVDREFFGETLWAEAADKAAEPRRRWREQLRDLASDVFTEAAAAAPRTEMRRIRAVARARSMLDAQMHKWLKEVPDGE